MSAKKEIVSQSPVLFIGGTMRSGTSLVRAILGSHSMIGAYPRDLPILNFAQRTPGVIEDRELQRELIQRLIRHPKATYIQNDFLEIAMKYFEDKQFTLYDLTWFFLKTYASKVTKVIPALKTPNNEVHIDQILKNFPNAKFVHVIRDPRNVEASRMQRTSYWKDEPLYHLNVWRRSAQLATKGTIAYPERYIVLKYEDLILNIEGVTRRLCDFLDLDFESSMLKFEGLEDWSGGNSSFGNMQPSTIDYNTLNRYKDYLTKPRVEFIESYLALEMVEYGYMQSATKSISIFSTIYSISVFLDFRNVKKLGRRLRQFFGVHRMFQQ